MLDGEHYMVSPSEGRRLLHSQSTLLTRDAPMRTEVERTSCGNVMVVESKPLVQC